MLDHVGISYDCIILVETTVSQVWYCHHPTCYKLLAISCKLSTKTGNEQCRHSCSDLTLYQNFSAKLVMRVMVMFVEKIPTLMDFQTAN